MSIFQIKKTLEQKLQYKVTLIGILIAIFTSVFYYFSRYGFDNNSFYDILKVLSLSLILLIAPDFIFAFIHKKETNFDKWQQTSAWFLLITLISLTALGAFSLYFNFSVVYLVLGLGFLLFIWFFLSIFSCKIKNNLLFFFVISLFASFIPFFIYKTLLHDPLFIEKIIVGTAHVDIIHLSGLSNLIKTYNIPTIALDGISFFSYHWGSNWIFAFQSALIDIPSLKFYNLAYPVIFIPFLFKSFFVFFTTIRKQRKLPLSTDVLTFSILFIAIIGISPDIELNQSPLMTSIVVLSESYLVGLSFNFIILSLSIIYFSNEKKTSNINTKIFLLLVLPLLIALSGFIKISTAFLLSVTFGYFFLRLKWYKNPTKVLSILITAILVLLTYKITQYLAPGEDPKFEAFSFINRHTDSKFYFLLFYYLYTIIFLSLFFFKHKIKNIKYYFEKRKTLELELLMVISIVGFIPGALIDTVGRNALYFMDLQRWLAILMIMAYLPYFSKKIKKIKLSLKNIKIIWFIPIIYFSIMLLINVPRNYYLHVKQAFIQNIYIRNQLIEEANINVQTLSLSSLNQNFEYKVRISQIAKEKLIAHQLIKVLEKLGKLCRNEKQKSCIYIPKTNTVYWEILKYKTNGIPFVASSFTGIAMIEGVPEILPQHFGFYTVKKNKNASKIFTDSEIVKSAQSKGFKQVFIIEYKEEKILTRTLHCEK